MESYTTWSTAPPEEEGYYWIKNNEEINSKERVYEIFYLFSGTFSSALTPKRIKPNGDSKYLYSEKIDPPIDRSHLGSRIKTGQYLAVKKGKTLGKPKQKKLKNEDEILELLKLKTTIRKTAELVGVTTATVQAVKKKNVDFLTEEAA